jgi:hypothetical protein
VAKPIDAAAFLGVLERTLDLETSEAA